MTTLLEKDIKMEISSEAEEETKSESKQTIEPEETKTAAAT